MMLRASALAAACVFGFVTSAQAISYNETFLLTGAQETPPNNSPGFGAAQVNVQINSNTLSWTIISANLSSALTAAHFHGPALPGQTAPPVIDVGAISGLSSNMAGSAPVTLQQQNDIAAGLWYLNLHTVNFPGGEIRGQLPALSTAAVPEPAAAGLLIVGVSALAARLRKRA